MKIIRTPNRVYQKRVFTCTYDSVPAAQKHTLGKIEKIELSRGKSRIIKVSIDNSTETPDPIAGSIWLRNEATERDGDFFEGGCPSLYADDFQSEN